ncbi:MAG: hypothetical protein ACRDQD_32675 [Nocardioidaceae bacterium]
MRSYAAPAAGTAKDAAGSFDTKAAPNCGRSEITPRKSKNGARVFATGLMGCRVDPPPFVRVVVRLQERVRSGDEFVFLT